MSNEIRPLSPSDIGAAKLANFPPVVIKIINDLLAAETSGRNGNYSATIKQKDIVDAIKKEFGDTYMGTPINKAIDKGGWLNFEPIFEAAGWKVSYDRPGYNESYEASFEFTTKRIIRD